MFLASRAGRRWRWIALGLVLLLAASYLIQRGTGASLHGGSPWGLAYGILGALLVLVLLFFGVRKRWYRSTWGTLEGWLQAHLNLGLVSVGVVLLHSGLRFGDQLAVWTLGVLVAVVASGVLGAVLYLLLPRLLTEVESNLTASDLSRQLNQLSRSMARLAAGKSAAFLRIYRGLMDEATPRRLAGWRLLVTRSGRRRRGGGEPADWTRVLGLVAAAEQDDLRQLLVLSRQQRELHQRLLYQQYYRNWLDVWLYLHVPLSLALLVLMLAHTIAALYYRGL